MTETPTPIDRLTDVYVWGYPLLVMHRTRAVMCSRGVGVGRFSHLPMLVTHEHRQVVAPNHDTLYSNAWIDLRQGDHILDVAPMDGDRYWSIMVLDAYTHIAGYGCRRLHGTAGIRILVTRDPPAALPAGVEDVITVSTSTAWLLGRTVVDGPADLEAARTAQTGLVVHAPTDATFSPVAPPPGLPQDIAAAGAGFFDELRAALAVDPAPADHPRPPEGIAILGAPAETLEEAVRLGEQRIIASAHALVRESRQGWSTSGGGESAGDPLARAAVAKFGLAAHLRVENSTYQTGLLGGAGERLNGDRPVELRFPPGGDPPASAFWSLTVYDSDRFLVANEIDRYCIGSRTPGLRRDTDGGLTIRIGGTRPSDVSNWLPAPSGAYGLGLRVYEGAPEVVDGTWFPPALVEAH